MADWSGLGGACATVRRAVGDAEVQGAADGFAAARLAASWRPHAIVIDAPVDEVAVLAAAIGRALPRTAVVAAVDHPGDRVIIDAAVGDRPGALLLQPRPLVAHRLAPALERVRRVHRLAPPRTTGTFGTSVMPRRGVGGGGGPGGGVVRRIGTDDSGHRRAA